jgi:hypothetical protein
MVKTSRGLTDFSIADKGSIPGLPGWGRVRGLEATYIGTYAPPVSRTYCRICAT